MERYLKISGYLNIAVGISGIVIALLVVILCGGPSEVLLIDAREGGSTSTDEGIAVAVYLVFLVLMAGPLIISGLGLLRFQEWARNLGMVVSIVALLHVPFGTIAGIYTLWVLTSYEVEPLFKAPPARPSKPNP